MAEGVKGALIIRRDSLVECARMSLAASWDSERALTSLGDFGSSCVLVGGVLTAASSCARRVETAATVILRLDKSFCDF